MAACGSLHHIFESPLPENPTLLESLSSWSSKSIKPVKHTDHQPSFTEIFGELHFKENPQSQSSSSSSSVFASINKLKEDKNGGWSNITESKDHSPRMHKKSDSFTSMNFESLQLCTEGLGFESSADGEDTKNLEVMSNKDWEKKRVSSTTKHHYSPFGNYHSSEGRRSRTEAFPPPISSIGKSGKPGVCFKSYREDGRFVLKEIRIPSQEFLRTSREDGRLKMHFVHSNDEIPEAEDQDQEEEEDEENKRQGDDDEEENDN